MKSKVISPYIPRKWAEAFHETPKRWMLLVVHRRAGKTTAALNFLIRSALTKPNTRYAYIAPTYKMAKNVAWKILKDSSRFVPGAIRRESELSVTFPNKSKITLYGAESPDSLRGIGLSGVVFDEYGMQPNNIFTEVIRPALLENAGYAIWIGTPKGKNEFHRLYEKHKNDDDWFIRHLTVNDTGVIDKAEIASSKKDMSQEEFAQEMYCSFESSIKGAVYAEELRHTRVQNRIRVLQHQRDQKVYTVWDIGIGAAMAIGFYQRIRGEVFMIDYWQGSESEGIYHAVHVVQQRYANYGIHFAPHDINVREISTGKSRLDYAREFGLSFSVIPQSQISAGIEAGKFFFSRLNIDEEKCAQWLDAMSQYKREWDDKKGMYNEIPYKNWTSHAADVHRYAATVEEEMVEEPPTIYHGREMTYQEELDSFDPYYPTPKIF